MAINPCAATPAAVCEDLFASLPPELTLHILSYLDGEDAVHCLAVNKSWREVVGSRDTYWKKACVQFGLPEDLIEEHILHKKCCASPVALFVAARRQRLYISQSSGVFARLERDGEYSVPNRKPSKTGAEKGHVVTPPTLPGKKRKSQRQYQAPCTTTYMGSGHFVEVVYAKEHLIPHGGVTGCFPPRREVAFACLGRFNGKKIEKVCVIDENIIDDEVLPNARVGKWLQFLPQYQCIVTASTSNAAMLDDAEVEIGRKYLDNPMVPRARSQSNGTRWLKWSITKKSPHAMPSPLSVPFSAGYVPYSPYGSYSHPVNIYSACSHCSMMVMGITMKPTTATERHDTRDPPSLTWNFSFIAFGPTGELAHVHTEKINVSGSRHPHKVALASSPNSFLTNNVCSSHNLIFQSGRHVGIHRLETVVTPKACLAFDFNLLYSFELKKGNDQQLGWHSDIGEITVSSDGTLLGILHHIDKQAILHLWSLTASGCTKVGEVKTNEDYPVLRALGHTYSIIQLSNYSDTTVSIAVIATHTGETVWKYTKQVKSIADHTPGFCMVHSRPEIHYLAVIREDWLSNIHTVSLPFTPFVAFRHFAEAIKGNLAIEGLSFQP